MRILRPLHLVLLLAWLAMLGCSNAKIDKMIPGGHIGSGELECWLVLEFDSYPNEADPRDVKVRFHSVALSDTPEFDWAYIAGRDVVSGERFGDGNRRNEATTAATEPPLGQPIKVKFPLYAKREIEVRGDEVWLHADLYWGGVKQDSAKRDIQRLYVSKDAEGPNPWTI
jgi:hypothetical protein